VAVVLLVLLPPEDRSKSKQICKTWYCKALRISISSGDKVWFMKDKKYNDPAEHVARQELKV
jgi:hypothetical protein